MSLVSDALKNVLELVADGPLAINKIKAIKRLVQEGPRRNELEDSYLLHTICNVLSAEGMLSEKDIDKMVADLYSEG